MASSTEVFRLRLNCVDHYQSVPGPLDSPIWGRSAFYSSQRNNLPQVPVIRVFGATQTGQKVCAHVHGAFPYLYVPYVESIERDHVGAFLSAFRQAADHALALSYRRNPYENPRSSTFVAHVSLVKGVPFFGYNVGYRYYLKVYLLNPSHMVRFADLLLQGAVMKQIFQPHEAHIQYLLQWMCDFNLYGCAFIDTDRPHFRSPVPSWDHLEDPNHCWHDRSILKSSILDPDRYPRQSHCQIEIDLRVEDILNRRLVEPRPMHHSFVERLASLENLPIEEKLVHSMAGLWKDESRRRKMRLGLTDPSSSPFPPDVLLSMSADPREERDGGWIHEEEFRAEVAKLADHERQQRGDVDLSFIDFEKSRLENDGVQTVLESVEELFHTKLEHHWAAIAKQDESNDIPDGTGLVGGSSEESLRASAYAVDANDIAQLAEEEDYGSDEEIARTQALANRQQNVEIDAEQFTAADPIVDDETFLKAEELSMQKGAVSLQHSGQRSRKRVESSGSQSPFKKVKFGLDERTPSSTPPFKVKNTSVRKLTEDKRPALTNAHGSRLSEMKAGILLAEDALASAPPSAQPHSSQSSSQGSKLGFPVVKNGSEEEVSLRLSQRDDLSHIPHRSSQSNRKDPFAVSSNESLKSQAGATSQYSSNARESIDTKLVANYRASFDIRANSDVFLFGSVPPRFDEVESTVTPSVIYQDAYYSNEKDVPERPREYAGQEFRLESNTLPYLPPFDRNGAIRSARVNHGKTPTDLIEERRRKNCSLKVWEIMRPPPTWYEVELWTKSERSAAGDGEIVAEIEAEAPRISSQLKRKNRPAAELSQIDGPTQKNEHGFKYSQRKPSTSVQHETGYMSTMSLEVHANSRGDLAPDPEKDEVDMIIWCIADDHARDKSTLGILALNNRDDDRARAIRHIVGEHIQVDAEDNELDLINRVVDIVREHDPDILTGYEVHNGSWGYLIERARLQYEFKLTDEFARVKSQSHGRFGKDADRWGFTHTSTVSITGRHTINIWRAMRAELNLLQYTMENIVFHLLHRRIPHYSFKTLTKWSQSKTPRDLVKLLDYFMTRTRLDLEILDANELVPRTSEQARLLGVDFFSVFSRGSQFKTESLMFRIAKPESFVLVSPSRKQVGSQNALECLPLVMEPQSAFYSSPLLVLDFQSLYPSVMIAYNYCYSTCLGRIVNWRGTNKLGFADFQRTPGLLELVQDKLNVAPNGLMYVKPEMRRGLLAKMLSEILETRVMVKSGMKVDKDDKTLQQLLNNRQLALKLSANVTYGYTSASFSGRMPCAEIADSIVQTARETLERTIAFIHSIERWGAEIVYGDTDSLFVYLKGRTRAQAFQIGEEIAQAVTERNPRPVKLKFEKVYHPCVLLAKKRYVGFKYESVDQTEPEFDAKGIETVRRDGTPAEQKMEETAMKLLFRTADLSAVKGYFQAQCAKILAGRVSIQDFCFAKEVKLGMYSDKGPPPPGAIIATRKMLRDPRSEPQYGERVPYVVVAGAPGARLWERCVEPEQLLHDEHAELDAEYYISKNLIPPLERIFNLVGANVRHWFDEMPKIQRIRMLGGPRDGDATAAVTSRAKKTMESYMGSSLCLVCRAKLSPVSSHAAVDELPLCVSCRTVHPRAAVFALRQKLQSAEKRVRDIEDVCRSCSGLVAAEEVRCDSRDCPVFYSRVKAQTQLRVAENGMGRVLKAVEEEEARKIDYEW